MEIRRERPEDVKAIRTLISAAFQNAPHTNHNEAAIVDTLRNSGALTLSLVAVDNREIVGHIAFSPVTINGKSNDWYGLGPVSVQPGRQRQGIGRTLIQIGLNHLRDMNAQGCVVLGDPAYYSRFGFVSEPNLRYGSVPPAYFQRLQFTVATPTGEASFHPAFHAT